MSLRLLLSHSHRAPLRSGATCRTKHTCRRVLPFSSHLRAQHSTRGAMTDKILAEAPGEQCCQGMKHSGAAKGKIEKIGGVDTYVATPAQGIGKAVILYFADVWGPFYDNSKLLQDHFAEQGACSFWHDTTKSMTEVASASSRIPRCRIGLFPGRSCLPPSRRNSLRSTCLEQQESRTSSGARTEMV